MLDKKSNRGLGLFILGIFVISILVAIAPAQAAPTSNIAAAVEKTINQIVDISKPVLKLVVGFPDGSVAGELAMRFLVFLLVTIVIYGILNDTNIFGTKAPLNVMIGVIVSLIGIRFLPAGFLLAMATPSSALVALITVVIPFVVVGYFATKIKSSVGRKAVWIIFGVMITVLWVYNVVNNYDALKWGIWVYPIALVVIILALVLDGTIQKSIRKQEAMRALNNVQQNQLSQAEREIEVLEDQITHLSTKYDLSKPAQEAKYNAELRVLTTQKTAKEAIITGFLGGAGAPVNMRVIWWAIGIGVAVAIIILLVLLVRSNM
ncbi:MAG: ABC transporter C-terminal domain-containing protein [Nanoarchaeota archaeon]